MKFRVFLLCIYLICSLSHAQQIKIGADEWPGFTNSDGSGIYFELLKRIYPEYDLDITVDSYTRVLNSFGKKNLDIVVGVYREDVQEGIIPHWFLDIEYPITAFYDPTVTKIKNINDINNLKASWKRGYQFNNFMPDIKDVYLVNNTETGFKLLEKNRVDVFIDYPKNLLKKYQQQFTSIEIVPSRYIYVAFQQNKKGDQLAKQFDKKMSELRDSAELATIFGTEYIHSTLDKFNSHLIPMVIITDNVDIATEKNLDEQSIDSLLYHLIKANLKNYHIEFQVLHSLQNINTYQNKENTCFNLMVKTDEREKHFIFSKPSSLYMGLRLYSKTDLHLSHSIDLAQFLANHPLTKLGMIKGQRYGDAIDTQLNNISQDQINYISVDKALKLAMFNQGDVDYIIEYSEDIAIAWPQISKEKLYSYKIKNSDKYVLGHMMCSKTNSGAKFIDAYNLALQNLTHSKVFFDIQYSTISEDSQADFIQYFDDVFKE